MDDRDRLVTLDQPFSEAANAERVWLKQHSGALRVRCEARLCDGVAELPCRDAEFG
jgi:hypothetical protein